MEENNLVKIISIVLSSNTTKCVCVSQMKIYLSLNLQFLLYNGHTND